MRTKDRLGEETAFHDEQAAGRAGRFPDAAALAFADDDWLGHETWIHPAFDKLGDLASQKGTPKDARKLDHEATRQPLTDAERSWLEAVVNAQAKTGLAVENFAEVVLINVVRNRG